MNKKIALELFGEFRTYHLNFENNMKTLMTQLSEYDVDVFIFSESKDSDKEKDIIDIINTYDNITIKMFKYYEDVDESVKNKSKQLQETFNNNVDSLFGEETRIKGKHGYNRFTIEYIFRKYACLKSCFFYSQWRHRRYTF